ncbi:protein Red-like [Actinia tenebrosa]|uniref:Protein Red-like n=1 Tax=Actinia tenebrosa TaxID=6105 RepID=A0A6P8HQP1_ACTTE|nr:protein Red-like [Actinia tenebrosa]
MPEESAVFSNPLAPPSAGSHHHHHGGHSSGSSAVENMTNADFRKLLMTPRSTPKTAPPTVKKRPELALSKPRDYNEEEDPTAQRRKKKKYYAKLHKMEEEREQELAQKYRDRARERRDGLNPDYQATDTLSATANYRAVGPTQEESDTAAERRRLAIQESKFLGGDMEHTHLVKGLDFALLQKVRSEINDLGEETVGEVMKKAKHKDGDEGEGDEDEVQEFKTKLGQKIYKAVFKVKPPEKNELFQPGRMAYVFEVEDEYAETDIPTTLIRSKADCPGMETQTTLTTNDIVINKLTQILSYLRQGMRNNKKLKKKDKGKEKEKEPKIKPQSIEDSIYGEIGEYDPTLTTRDLPKKDKHREKSKEKSQEKSKHSGRDHDRKSKSVQYFEKPSSTEKEESFSRKDVNAAEFAKDISEKFRKRERTDNLEKGESKSKSKKSKHEVPDSYMECYPDAAGVAYESDDEADYTKMDLGNKKGPIKRWDFENEEDYNEYMETREALPKAAFQFGIKMSEGRKTRRTGPKDEKAKLDRDWQRISRMIHAPKKKEEDDHERKSKRSKHD